MRRIRSFFRWFDSRAELLRYVKQLEARNAQLQELNAHTEDYVQQLASFHEDTRILLNEVIDDQTDQYEAQRQLVKKLSGVEW